MIHGVVFVRGVVAVLVVGCTSVDSPRPQVDEPLEIWTEQPIAAVTIGLDHSGKPVGREFRLVAVGAASRSSETVACIEKATRDVSVELQRQLVALAGEGSTGVDALPARTDAAVEASIVGFAKHVERCAANVGLAIVQRHCVAGTPCARDEALFAGDPQAAAFTVLARWGDLRNTESERTLPPNVLVLLPHLADDAVKPIEVSLRENAALPARVPVMWPAPAADEAQLQFEALVAVARTRGHKIERTAARLADVPAEIAERVIDALDAPGETIADLRKVPGATLQRISDEVARTRIRECVKFRGIVELEVVAGCAGYKVSEVELRDCLAGRRCVPTLDATAFASVIATSFARGSLAEASELPRLPSILEHSIDEAIAPVAVCVKQPTEAKAAECLLDRQLGKEARRMRACFKAKTASVDKLACAVPLSADARRVVDCATKHKDDREAQAICIAGATLPPEALALMRCRREHHDDVALAACMATTTIHGGTAERAVACVKTHRADYAAAALCLAGDQLPPDVAYAVECAQSSDDAMGAAACLGTKALPAKLRKPVQCLAESGGDPLGAGLCMAADAKGLTAEQRIVLQCLVSTGGEPTAMATCTSGRLIAKEMMQCVGKKVFEDNCVGKNNAFRKLFEGVTHQELGPNSMVADYLNFQMDIVEAQIAVAKGAFETADTFGKNIIREHRRAAKNVERAIGQAGKDVTRETKSLGKKAEKLIKQLTPKIRIRVPKKVNVTIKWKKKPKWL